MNALEQEFEKFLQAVLPRDEVQNPTLRNFAWMAFMAGAGHVCYAAHECVGQQDSETFWKLMDKIEDHVLRLSNGTHTAPTPPPDET